MKNQLPSNKLPANKLPAVHPGEFLAEIFADALLKDKRMTPTVISKNMRVPVSTIISILKCKGPITDELALSFGNYFGQSKQYWLNLQTAYDLKVNSSK
jgi:addiction module HigA family antidote